MKEFHKRILISRENVEKAGARDSARQYFAGTLSAIARDLGTGLLESMGRRAAGNVRASVSQKCARVSKTCGLHAYLIRDSSRQCKRAAELAMRWRWAPSQEDIWPRDSD